MLGWIIIFAMLSLFGFTWGHGSGTQNGLAGYGLSVMFGTLFALSLLIRGFSRHSS